MYAKTSLVLHRGAHAPSARVHTVVKMSNNPEMMHEAVESLTRHDAEIMRLKLELDEMRDLMKAVEEDKQKAEGAAVAMEVPEVASFNGSGAAPMAAQLPQTLSDVTEKLMEQPRAPPPAPDEWIGKTWRKWLACTGCGRARPPPRREAPPPPVGSHHTFSHVESGYAPALPPVSSTPDSTSSPSAPATVSSVDNTAMTAHPDHASSSTATADAQSDQVTWL